MMLQVVLCLPLCDGQQSGGASQSDELPHLAFVAALHLDRSATCLLCLVVEVNVCMFLCTILVCPGVHAGLLMAPCVWSCSARC
jgi:hypothetical protein